MSMSVDLTRCDVLQSAIQQNIVSESEPLALFFDVDYFEKLLNQFKNSFPLDNVTYLHNVAVKSGPLPKIMPIIARNGFGAEAASFTEVEIALRNGIPPNNIVWDSPCKTIEEIRFGFSKGINMNADNEQELERFQSIVGGVNPENFHQMPKFLGIRVNPCLGVGERAETSTCSLYSKFGLPIEIYEDRIVGFFAKYNWLNTLHFHIGSQNFGVPGLVEAVRLVYNLAEKINTHYDGAQKVVAINIGGGLPAFYDCDQYENYSKLYSDFVAEIKKRVPGFFSGKYTILTENGRTFTTKCGFAVSRIEYTKEVEDLRIVTQHIGSDLLMRTCYLPDKWPMRMFVCNKDGSYKEVSNESCQKQCDVAGPICFEGDKIALRRPLTNPEPGDWLIVCDTGGYSIALWNRHCARLCPAVYQYHGGSNSNINKNEPIRFDLLKKKELLDQAIGFYQ